LETRRKAERADPRILDDDPGNLAKIGHPRRTATRRPNIIPPNDKKRFCISHQKLYVIRVTYFVEGACSHRIGSVGSRNRDENAIPALETRNRTAPPTPWSRPRSRTRHPAVVAGRGLAVSRMVLARCVPDTGFSPTDCLLKPWKNRSPGAQRAELNTSTRRPEHFNSTS